ASEQQRVHAVDAGHDRLAALGVGIRRLPAAELEPALTVLVGPTRRLVHAVKCDEKVDGEDSHYVLLRVNGDQMPPLPVRRPGWPGIDITACHPSDERTAGRGMDARRRPNSSGL